MQPAPAVSTAAPTPSPPALVQIDVTPSHLIQTFDPRFALGSTVDKEPAGTIPRLYSRQNVNQMLRAGWGFLSYRLFTELSDQDWHWNPAGTFSGGTQGYWTSDSATHWTTIGTAHFSSISDSFGYRLPHRGNSSDQGDNADYSRLDDGDPHTYWKSDPYLAQPFTGDPDEMHPQWAVIDLGAKQPVDAVKIAWVDPFAAAYDVQYWTGPDAMGDPTNGRWVTFSSGSVRDGQGGTALLRLAPAPVKVEFVRIVMTRSSDTCDTHDSRDRRNCVGYAIDEVSVGTLDASGAFHDLVRHAPCSGVLEFAKPCGAKQTTTYVSSVDPWHSPEGRVHDQEQPGLDLIARSGLTRGLPAIYPVAMLYSTPENAVAEVRYLKARGYPIMGIELGEEPDGQYTEPEDDATLFVQWARAIHAIDPKLKLGGPVFSGVNSDLVWWPDQHGVTSWLTRFLAYLKAHGAEDQLGFMSFEHYPFDGCEHGDKLHQDLLQEPGIMKTVVDAWQDDGLPSSIPMYVTEAGFSSVNFTQVPMQVEGALWQADYMGSALSDGVSGAVYYQYEPVPLSRNTGCPTDWGNLTMFVADDKAVIHAKGAQFFAGQMLTQQWVAYSDGTDALYPASTNLTESGVQLMTAYAVKRHDGSWSVMLINKDDKPHDVSVRFVDYGSGASGPSAGFAGNVTFATFGSAQYVWHQSGAASAPSPDGPPAISTIDDADGQSFTIPADSITVLRGSIGRLSP
jgi:hypothetical protein